MGTEAGTFYRRMEPTTPEFSTNGTHPETSPGGSPDFIVVSMAKPEGAGGLVASVSGLVKAQNVLWVHGEEIKRNDQKPSQTNGHRDLSKEEGGIEEAARQNMFTRTGRENPL
jgi:hypothetical protein